MVQRMFASCKSPSSPGRVGAFRQPKAAWIDIEIFAVNIATDQDLGARRFARLLLNNRQQSVRRGAGDDLQHACLAKFIELREQIALPNIDKEPAAFAKMIEIELRERAQLFVFPVALEFALRELDQKIDMSHVTLAQKIVLQHRAKRRRDRHRELERDSVAHQPLHHDEQRNVSLADRLEEPVFFEESFRARDGARTAGAREERARGSRRPLDHCSHSERSEEPSKDLKSRNVLTSSMIRIAV